MFPERSSTSQLRGHENKNKQRANFSPALEQRVSPDRSRRCKIAPETRCASAINFERFFILGRLCCFYRAPGAVKELFKAKGVKLFDRLRVQSLMKSLTDRKLLAIFWLRLNWAEKWYFSRQFWNLWVSWEVVVLKWKKFMFFLLSIRLGYWAFRGSNLILIFGIESLDGPSVISWKHWRNISLFLPFSYFVIVNRVRLVRWIRLGLRCENNIIIN